MTVAQRAKTVVLACWATFFTWLLLSGKVTTYIGPRTYWVVVFGAVCLTLATAALLILRPADAEAPSQRMWVGHAAMLVPLMLVVLVPEPGLGSLAASRKSSGGVVSAASLQPPSLAAGESVSFEQISYAVESEDYAASLGIADGYGVDLTGFVSGADGGTLALSRFSIFCCAADAVPYTVPVRVADGQTYPVDQWLRVRGVLTRDGDTLVISGEMIEAVEPPENPYI